MPNVRALVLRAPGTNCDHESQHAFELAGASVERIHVNRILEEPTILDAFQIFCVPGGFSYGDDVAAGKILAHQLNRKLGDPLRHFRDRGGLILGVCNGFQVLLRTGLLVEPDSSGNPQATLAFNKHGRFEDRWIHLAITPGRCKFLEPHPIITLPIAHAEGNFLAATPEVLQSLTAAGRVVARYVDEKGNSGGFPINPNGSMGDIAGICDESGHVFALMPHPERHLYSYQHPQFTRRKVQPAQGDGLQLFQNAVKFFA